MIFKRILKKSSVQSVVYFFVEFFDNIAIHGFSNLARTNIHWLEFLFWLLNIIFMSTCAIRICTYLATRYETESIIATFNNNFMHWNTTTPAFTFCPRNVLDDHKLEEYIRQQPQPSKVTNQELSEFLYKLSHMNIANVEHVEMKNYGIWSQNYMQLIFNLSKDHRIIASDGLPLVRTVSDVGICYTYNNVLITDAVASFYWGDHITLPSHQHLVPKTINYFDKYPQNRYFDHDIDALSYYIHSPYEMPTSMMRPVATVTTSKRIQLKVKIVDVSYDIKLLRESRIEQRRCRAPHETNLLMFPHTYSRHLCLMQCRANTALYLCGCLPHFYARWIFRKLHRHRKICNVRGLQCLAYHREVIGKAHIFRGRNNVFNCSACLPNCNEMILQTATQCETVSVDDKSEAKWRLWVQIQTPPLGQIRRSLMMTSVDFAVSVGNVMAVFLGASMLSFIDVVYNFTLRLFWYRRGYRPVINYAKN